jgi:radical SAM protein with 4Fe4S-binding SPASM domain
MGLSLRRQSGKKWKYARAWMRQKLVHLNLQILYQCNFRCHICDFWKPAFKDSPRLSADQVQHIAGQLDRYGPMVISIGGGEPLLHDELIPICEALSPSNFLVMITNGSLMTEDKARAIMAAGLYEVSVSVDYANRAAHDRQRQFTGAFDKACAALEMLQRNRVHAYQRVNMISVVMDDNLDEIEPLITLSKELGVTYLVTMYSDKRGAKARAVDPELTRRLLDIKKRNRHFVTVRGYLEKFSQAKAEGVLPCHAGKNLFNVDCQGNVTLCIDTIHDPVGNILHDDIFELERRLLEKHRTNTCGTCWTSCRGPVETLMYGRNRLRNLRDYYQLTRDVPLNGTF